MATALEELIVISFHAINMNKLFLDIETLPADESSQLKLEYLFKRQLEKKSKKKDASEEVEIEGKVADKFDDYLGKTSLDGGFGRVLCIGYAVNNEATQVLYEPTDEIMMLRKFWLLAETCDLFIGHNVMDFDLRFLFQRSVVLKVKPTKDLNFARYRNHPIFDTMREWTKWNRDYIGLEHVALALGFSTPKEGVDGSQVADFHKQGRDKEICDYCMRDVETTRQVYKRMVFET